MTSIDQVIDKLRPTLELIEQDRLSYLKNRNKFIWMVIVPGVLIACFPSFMFFPKGVYVMGGWLVVSGIAYHCTVGVDGREYVEAYKNSVPGNLVKLIGENLHYDQNQGIEQEAFEASELFTTSPDQYSTEDLIHGTYGQTTQILAEVEADERRTQYINGKAQFSK